jgi:VanZ family protein
MILFRLAFFPPKKNYGRGEALKLISLFLLFAIMSEVIQSFIPYRSFNLNDLIANIFGILIGLLILFVKPRNVPAKLTANHHE